MNEPEKLIIGLAGLGTVGSGLVTLLNENQDEIVRRTGKKLVLKAVAVRDLSKPRNLPDGVTLIDDPLLLSTDTEIQVVVELIGGLNTAEAVIIEALKHGKPVVTANKALLAERGGPIFALAAEKKLPLGYESSVAGAIPIVEALKNSLDSNKISSITGILNGTGNFILSGMSSKGRDFATALAEAQELGYAESDPSLDIDGHDTAHKLALLIRLAWGKDYPYSKLAVNGIRGMSSMDIEFAREFGYRIKMIGQARMENGRIEAGVFPALVHHTLLLARVGGAFNAIRLEGNAAGSIFLHGLGAGSRPTASAVLADLMAIARNCTSTNSGFADDNLPPADILPSEKAVSPWYVRMMVRDNSGVLRDISGAMAQENVSIAQVIQKQDTLGGVPIFFMTHATKGESIHAAVRYLEKSGLLLAPAITFRVLAASGDSHETAPE